jgi:hypothetical protein
MSWWRRLSGLRRFLLIGLVVSLLGEAGAFTWSYPWWPFSIVGSVLVLIAFFLLVREGPRSPIPARPDLTPDEFQRQD